MINLMRADWYRMFRGIGIYLAMTFVVLISGVSVGVKESGYVGNATILYEGDAVVDTDESPVVGLSAVSMENKMLVRSIVASNVNLYCPLIMVVFVILMSDFSNKTLKNTLTSVTSKRKYFFYKLLMSLGCSAVFVIVSNLFSYVLNYIVNGNEYTESIFNIFKATALQMPILLGMVSFLVFVGFLTRKTAAYNAFTIPFVLLFQIILGLVLKVTQSEWIGNYLANYEWQTALDKLAYFPEKNYCLQCLGLGLLEMVGFACLSWIVFKKAEVK